MAKIEKEKDLKELAKEKDLKELANELNQMRNDIRYNTTLQVLYTGRLIEKYLNAKASFFNQSRSRIQLLTALITHGGVLPPTKLANMMFVSKQTISGIVSGLERDGLVERELRGKDLRTKKVFITKAGVVAMAKVVPQSVAVANAALPKINKEALDALNATLRQIRTHLLGLLADGNAKG